MYYAKGTVRMSNYQIQDLPNELLLKVQDYMETKDQIRFGQLSKRFRVINETMWQKVNLCEMIVPVGFIEMILNQKCQYLSLYRAKMEGSSNLRIKSNELKYLDLSACDGNESFLEEILESCSSLEKLSMYNLKLSSKMISSICIQNGKTLKILDMEGCYGLDLEAIKWRILSRTSTEQSGKNEKKKNLPTGLQVHLEDMF